MLNHRHIPYLTWLLSGMMLLMIAACNSSDDGGRQEGGTDKKPAMLAIYVYAPEQAAAAQQKAAQTRANEGEVDVISAAEREIKSLQLWIYEHISGNYVGYVSVSTEEVTSLNTGEGVTYQIPVSDDFASRKPSVDVYVHANVKANNCGVGTLNEETSRAALMSGAKITKNSTMDYFGLGNLQMTIPSDGLPMAGKLTMQPVVGEAPALRVGDLSQVSTVQLTRAVSKLRFVFAKTTGQATVCIKSIKIDAGMIPEVEYLFDTTQPLTYNTTAGELLLTDIEDIAATKDPTVYLYYNQEAQKYEDLINEAASKENPEVTVRGPIYLRESDKQLTGTISYTIGGGELQTATFTMQQAGDFSRNHTWIVYAYYAGTGGLQVQTIYVKNWENRTIDHDLFNW